ncbi:hypothetical protein QBC37DRAFT_300715, partial [Rhypophila decipiens]
VVTLGSYVRQIRTQTVWLTATLPPVREDDFVGQNMLVRPRLIRESTNRPNIRYEDSFVQRTGQSVSAHGRTSA